MSLLRMKELRELPEEDLRRKIAEIENDLLRERGIAAMGGAPPSPGRMRALRTNVARALTVLTERSRTRPAASAANARR
jgi:large subunit ribosomal protein L29